MGDMILCFLETLNTFENGTGDLAKLIPAHQLLTLNPGDEISAYLYWAGSGFGDFEVKLNDQDITAQKNLSKVTQSSSGLPFSVL
jgi:hypothetical protein